MSVRQRPTRILQFLGFLGLALLALVIAHNLEFILAYGPGAGAMLARLGHGRDWATAVAVVIAGAVALASLGAARLAHLWILARRLPPGEDRAPSTATGFGRGLANLWAWLTAAVVALFVIQENLEHLRAGADLPGLAVLGSRQYPSALVVITIVSLAVAFVAMLYRWQRERLIARIAAARRHPHPRPPRRAIRAPLDLDGRPESIVGRRLAGRAPPIVQPG
jgi:hypothetical protein